MLEGPIHPPHKAAAYIDAVGRLKDLLEHRISPLRETVGPGKERPGRAEAQPHAPNDYSIHGFGANAILNARRSLEAELAWDDNSAAFAYLGPLAIDRLLERPASSPTELLDRVAVISPDKPNEVLRSALGSLIVAVDKDARVKKKDAKALGLTLDPYEIWQPPPHVGDEEALQKSVDGHRVWGHKSSKTLVWLTQTLRGDGKPGKRNPSSWPM